MFVADLTLPASPGSDVMIISSPGTNSTALSSVNGMRFLNQHLKLSPIARKTRNSIMVLLDAGTLQHGGVGCNDEFYELLSRCELEKHAANAAGYKARLVCTHAARGHAHVKTFDVNR